jgi:hypothetical protein
LRRTSIIALSLILPAAFAVSYPAPAAEKQLKTEQQHFDGIQEQAKRHDTDGVKEQAAEFFKLYPESPRVPDVRCILAETEKSPEESIAKYRVVVGKYRFYKKRDYAQYRICEIEYLQSRWKNLAADARAGLGLGPGSYDADFGFFLVISLIHLGDYEASEKECRRLIDSDHDFNNMARSLLILTHIYKNTSGLSREYINTLREIAIGYGKSDAFPAALYLLGEFYEQKKMFNESYSAYSDLSAKYPGSPEAAEASKRVSALMKHEPRRVSYLPGKNIVNTTESIDIRPETDVPGDNMSACFYSISVGPFPTLKNANELRKLLKNFDFIKTVRLKNGYALYVGKSPDEESAIKAKVRLAEEYGINGSLVRISGDGQRSYIYGE